MKFLFVSIALLVCSITYPEQLIAQQGSPKAFTQIATEELQETYEILLPRNVGKGEGELFFLDFLRKTDTSTLSLQELSQMYKQLALSFQLIGLFEKADTQCLIQLESQWVDFRSQCQSTFDRLQYESKGKMPLMKFLFYETLMGELSPKIEVLIEAMWAEENEFLDEYRGESLYELKLLFAKAHRYLSFLEQTSILLVSNN